MAILLVILMGLGIHVLLTKLIGVEDKHYLISGAIAIIVCVGFLFFCKRRETLCAAYDLEKQRRGLSRSLTGEEKKQVRTALKQQKQQSQG